MVIELEKVLYEYLKTLIEDIKKNVEEEKTTREEMVQTSIKGLSINVREYKIKDGVYKGLYVYISDYAYNSDYEEGNREKRTETCITSIDQFEKVKSCKRRFSPTDNIQDCSFIVFENRDYQRDSISFMIKGTPEDPRYVYRITESQRDKVYEAKCEKHESDPNGEKKYEQAIKEGNSDVINNIIMPKLQLYGNAMTFAKDIKKAISTDGYSTMNLNYDQLSQEEIFRLMCEFNRGRIVNRYQ